MGGTLLIRVVDGGEVQEKLNRRFDFVGQPHQRRLVQFFVFFKADSLVLGVDETDRLVGLTPLSDHQTHQVGGAQRAPDLLAELLFEIGEQRRVPDSAGTPRTKRRSSSSAASVAIRDSR